MIRKCRKCGQYTLLESCPRCGSETINAHPDYHNSGLHGKGRPEEG